MKKILIIAMALVLGASVTTVSADKKKDKKKKKASIALSERPVQLLSSRDSLSYASGFAATDGLVDYVQRQFQMDPAYMNDFIEAFKEALGKGDTPQFRAQSAGRQVAGIFENRILPNVAEQYANTPDSLDTEIFTKAFLDAVKGDTAVYNLETAKDYSGAKARAIKEEKETAWRIQNTQWLMANKDKEGVVTMPSGLQYKILTQGKGEVPTEKDRVTVKYEGRLIDGTVFDSSYERDPQTTAFRVNQVIKGWTEALCMMPVGSKWELYIPQDIAYGARQQGKDILPYSTLIFTVELVSIDKE